MSVEDTTLDRKAADGSSFQFFCEECGIREARLNYETAREMLEDHREHASPSTEVILVYTIPKNSEAT